MRLVRLELEKYGAFEGAALDFRSDARVHVVFGPNEAGKSSALAAVSDLLFGFGARTDYAFRHAMADLRLGATLRARDGRDVAFRRRKGMRATLVGQDDAPLDDALLAPFLGGLTREVFERAFGLGAESLRTGAEELLAADGESGASLFAAASGLRGVEEERRRLEAEADALFSPQARTRPFNELQKRHDAARRALGEAELGAAGWRRINDEIVGLGERLQALDDAGARARTERARLERLSRAHGASVEAAAARRALEAFGPAPELAQGALDALRDRLDEADGAATAAARAAENLDGAEADLARLAGEDDVVSAGEEIEALVRLSGAFVKGQQDLPRLEREADGEEEKLARLAVRLGVEDAAAIESALPTDAARAGLKEMIRQGERIAHARETLSRALAAERDKLAGLRSRLGAEPAADPRPLREALSGLARPLAALSRREELAAEHAREARKTAEAATRLSPPVADLDRAATRPMPAPDTIARARREQEALAGELARLGEATDRERQDAGRVAAELARLGGGAPVASPETIRAARLARETAWRPLRDHLVGAAEIPASERLASVADFERAASEADRLADRLVDDAARAALITDLSARAEALAAAVAEHETRRAALQQKAEAAADDWAAEWAEAGVAPRAPAEMEGWRRDIDALIARRALNADRAATLARLDTEEAALRPRLEKLAAEAGLTAPDAGDAASLAARVETRIGELADRFQAAATLRSQIADAEGRGLAAERDLAALDEEERGWRARWAAALPAVGLKGDASLTVASAALDAWGEAPALVAARTGLAQRVRGLNRDAEAFRGAVTRLVDGFAPALGDMSAEAAVNRLNERLLAARRTTALREEARRRRDEAAILSEAAERARAAAAERLAEAARGLPPGVELRPLVARIAERDGLRAEVEASRKRLCERGETADEAALEMELAAFERDAAPAEIERLTAEERRLAAEAQQVFAELAGARARRDALGGAKAEEAAADQRAAGAAMYAMGRDWAVKKIAALLLGAAMERARSADRSPVLERAGALFDALTGGAFSGFSEVYEKETPTLLGRRASGETVAIRAMSEGTRDQFYLALRLAYLDDYAARAEPAPFVGDDLFASFDDARTVHGLRALAAIGGSVQPILFTHHRAVAEAARRELGEAADVIELGG